MSLTINRTFNPFQIQFPRICRTVGRGFNNFLSLVGNRFMLLMKSSFAVFLHTEICTATLPTKRILRFNSFIGSGCLHSCNTIRNTTYCLLVEGCNFHIVDFKQISALKAGEIQPLNIKHLSGSCSANILQSVNNELNDLQFHMLLEDGALHRLDVVIDNSGTLESYTLSKVLDHTRNTCVSHSWGMALVGQRDGEILLLKESNDIQTFSPVGSFPDYKGRKVVGIADIGGHTFLVSFWRESIGLTTLTLKLSQVRRRIISTWTKLQLGIVTQDMTEGFRAVKLDLGCMAVVYHSLSSTFVLLHVGPFAGVSVKASHNVLTSNAVPVLLLSGVNYRGTRGNSSEKNYICFYGDDHALHGFYIDDGNTQNQERKKQPDDQIEQRNEQPLPKDDRNKLENGQSDLNKDLKELKKTMSCGFEYLQRQIDAIVNSRAQSEGVSESSGLGSCEDTSYYSVSSNQTNENSLLWDGFDIQLDNGKTCSDQTEDNFWLDESLVLDDKDENFWLNESDFGVNLEVADAESQRNTTPAEDSPSIPAKPEDKSPKSEPAC